MDQAPCRLTPPVWPPRRPPNPYGATPPVHRLPAPAQPLRRWPALGLVAVLVIAFGAVFAAAWRPLAVSAEFAAGAADALAEAPAVRIAYAYDDATGALVAGRFTVTSTGYASGTVGDAGSGLASFRITPESSAVYGDEDWWTRRAPDRVEGSRDRWIRPDAGTAFPLDVPASLSPKAIAALVRAITDGGRREPDTGETSRGERVLVFTNGAWSAALTETLRVVRVTGPFGPGGMRPSAFGGGAAVLPLGLSGGPTTAQLAKSSGDGMFSMSPEPGNGDDARGATSDSTDAVSGEAPTPEGMDPPAEPAPPGPPPTEAASPEPQPSFSVDIDAYDCDTPTCTADAITTNTGDAPGGGTLTVAATPGKSPEERDLGTLRPGQTHTDTFTMPNQASPGTSVSVLWQAWVYCRELFGDGNKGKHDFLRDNGIDPAKDPVISKVGRRLKPSLVDGAYGMLKAGADPAAVERALAEADRRRLLPELRALAEAGERFQGWGPIADKLGGTATEDQMRGYVGELRTAVEQLADPSRPTVKLEATVTEPGVRGDGTEGDIAKRSDLLVESDTLRQAWQIKTMATAKLVGALNDAIDQLNGRSQKDASASSREQAPVGYNGIVRINIVVSDRSEFYFLDWYEVLGELINASYKNPIKACQDRTLLFTEVQIKNYLGLHSYTRALICGN